MRVTNQLISNYLSVNISDKMESLYKLQNQISTGKEILKPSDDPAAAQEILTCREAIDSIDQYSKNINSATTWLSASENALSEIGDVLLRARELAEQWANGTYNESQREIVASEAESLLGQVVQLANTELNGRYLFAGHQTGTAPFQTDGTYTGDTGQIEIMIGEGTSLGINVDGEMAFNDTVDLFATLENLRLGLTTNDTELIAEQIEMLEAADEQILNAQAYVGARINRLETTEAHWTQLRTTLEERLSATEDIDLATALADLTVQENAYQALLSTAANIIQPNLLQFLS